MPASRGINHSRQRDAILSYILSQKDHPTAEMVYQGIREEYPKISLGTVYRNLTLLADLGLIQKINCGDDREHFDGKCDPHPHFICIHCKQVLDLEFDSADPFKTLATDSFPGHIHGYQLYFYGTCPDCTR